MSKITVTTIAGATSGSDANKVKIESGDTLQVESNATVGGTLGVTGATTLSSNVAVNGGTGGQVATNFSSASTMGMKINDTNSGNLGGMLGFYSGSGAGTLRANIQNANNAGVHFSVGTGGSVVFTQTGYTAANALDDYEEGIWTPTIGGSGATYANQQGLYTKVGRYVCAVFDITVNARNSGSTNELHGFPFTANTGVSPAMGVYSGHISFYSGVSQNLYSLDMYIINGQTYAYFTGHTSASGNIGNSLAVWQNGTRILGTVHYFAN